MGNLNINFYCKPSKVNSKGFAVVLLSIQIGNKRTFINLPRRERPSDFDAAMKSKKPSPIREYCDSVKRRVDEIVLELMENNIPLTEDVFKDYWKRGGASRAYTLEDMWNALLSVKASELGVSIEQETYDRYIIARDRFYEYTGLTPDTAAREVTQEHILKLRASIFKHYGDDAGGNHISRIKSAFKLAFDSGKIKSTPFAGIRLTRGVAHNNGAEIKFLTEKQLNRIRDKEFRSERLRRVADCFLFACFTGLSFIDMKGLTPEDFKTNDRGQIFIKKRRVKSGVEFTTILMADALTIAKKYDYKLPVLSGQKYNEYLHEIEALCEIPISLTSHVARHTAATYMLAHGVNELALEKMFGWKNGKMVRRYAKVLDETIFDDAARIQEEQFKADLQRICFGE